MTDINDTGFFRSVGSNGSITPAERFQRIENKVDLIMDKLHNLEIRVVIVATIMSGIVSVSMLLASKLL